MSDEDILERGGTQEDIDRYAHDVGGACGLAYGWTCDYCTTTDNTQEHTHIFRRGVDNTGEYKVCECGFRLEPHNTQSELDEVAQLLGIYLSEIDVDGSMPTNITRQDLERILDWHNKQIEKSMAKFSLKKGVKYDVKASDSVIVITPVNKLKESK